MPSKKKKYNARFPAGRIKKIMQTDDEVGKVAQAVPVIISRTLELFVESLLTKAQEITSAKNAKTLSPSHMKQCILSESRFDFLKELVASLPDVVSNDYDEGNFPVGMPPSVGSTNTTDVSSSNSRKAEKSAVSVPAKVTSQVSVTTDRPTSSAVAADFYKEINNSSNSVGSANSRLNRVAASMSVEDEELDEDYDTTNLIKLAGTKQDTKPYL